MKSRVPGSVGSSADGLACRYVRPPRLLPEDHGKDLAVSFLSCLAVFGPFGYSKRDSALRASHLWVLDPGSAGQA